MCIRDRIQALGEGAVSGVEHDARGRLEVTARVLRGLVDGEQVDAAAVADPDLVVVLREHAAQRARAVARVAGGLLVDEHEVDADPCLLYTSDAADERSSV